MGWKTSAHSENRGVWLEWTVRAGAGQNLLRAPRGPRWEHDIYPVYTRRHWAADLGAHDEAGTSERHEVTLERTDQCWDCVRRDQRWEGCQSTQQWTGSPLRSRGKAQPLGKPAGSNCGTTVGEREKKRKREGGREGKGEKPARTSRLLIWGREAGGDEENMKKQIGPTEKQTRVQIWLNIVSLKFLWAP